MATRELQGTPDARAWVIRKGKPRGGAQGRGGSPRAPPRPEDHAEELGEKLLRARVRGGNGRAQVQPEPALRGPARVRLSQREGLG